MSNFEINAGSLLEDFETIGDWTKGSNGAIAADTTFVKTGSNSLKLTSGDGSNCFATKTISENMIDAGAMFIWVYITGTDLALTDSFAFYLASESDFSKYFIITIDDAALHPGWNQILFSRDDWTTSNGESWSNTMVSLRVRINATSGTPTCYYDELTKARYNRPKCVITFDDSWDSAFSEGYDYMKTYKMRGTIYNIHSKIGNSGRMTLANLQTLFDVGWDISVHDSGNWKSDYDNQADVETAIKSGKNYLIKNKFTRNNMQLHAAYPEGGYDDDVLNAMTAQGMLTGRSIIERVQPNVLDNPQLLTRRVLIDTTTLAAAKVKVDDAINKGGCSILNFHKLVSSPSVSTEWPISDFQALVDYIFDLRNQIDVITMTEWYQGLTNPRQSVDFETLS